MLLSGSLTEYFSPGGHAMEIQELHPADARDVQRLILEIFSGPPWNDSWDTEQLRLYVQELLGGSGSLSWGLYEAGQLIGMALGRVKHWCAGTEYWMEEFGIHPKRQGSDLGSQFLSQVERQIRARGMTGIVLLTERTVPAYYFYQKHGFSEQPKQVFFTKVWE